MNVKSISNVIDKIIKNSGEDYVISITDNPTNFKHLIGSFVKGEYDSWEADDLRTAEIVNEYFTGREFNSVQQGAFELDLDKPSKCFVVLYRGHTGMLGDYINDETDL